LEVTHTAYHASSLLEKNNADHLVRQMARAGSNPMRGSPTIGNELKMRLPSGQSRNDSLE
jgi:hypothetical protein